MPGVGPTGFQWDEPCTCPKNTSYIYYIWSWYIYEIKIHTQYIYCHKFETKQGVRYIHNISIATSLKQNKG